MNAPLRKAVLESLPNSRTAVVKAVMRRGGYKKSEIDHHLDEMLWTGVLTSTQGVLKVKG